MQIQWIDLASHGDERGNLIALEENVNVPFVIKRAYFLFDTQPGVVRGFHAHKSLQQLVVCVSGQCRFILDNGKERVSLHLDTPSRGLLIQSCIWREMHDFSPDCVLLVLADQLYCEDDYIRDYDDFRQIACPERSSEGALDR